MAINPEIVMANRVLLEERLVDLGADLAKVSILAMTKGFGADAVVAARAAGLSACGENDAGALAAKAAELGDDQPEWHFTGRLQSRKVRLVADLVHLWQTVDRRSLVTEIAKRAPGARVLVQVNASGESQKGGADPDSVADLVAEARDHGLVVLGLMSMGVLDDKRATADAFQITARLADDLDLEVRSMGMSGDLAAAVAAGTTMVRVGTALFGPRPADR